jgi:hypothetical protein
MICCSRPVQHGAVLTAVKAEPSGWPTASLDPGSGRRRSTRTKSRPTEITQQDPPIQVSTVSGDCRPWRWPARASTLGRMPRWVWLLIVLIVSFARWLARRWRARAGAGAGSAGSA